MRFCVPTIAASLLAGLTLCAPPLSAQPTNPTAGKDLIVASDQTVDLEPGSHRYGLLQIDKGATIRIKGSTSILATKVVTDEQARIEYIKNSTPGSKIFVLNAIDSQGLKNLKVVGSGQDAPDHPVGVRAAAGGAGSDAASRYISPDKWYKTGYFKNESSSPGGPGAGGANGQEGEDAMDVTLYLPGLRSGAQLEIETIGGRGGRGQDGGNGGRGGNSSKLHTASRGGPGGRAGNGGDGGDAGKISVFLIVAPADMSKKDTLIKSVQFRPSYAAGAGGAPGDFGGGGPAGDTSGQFCIGSGCNANDGRPGPTGNPGSAGAGPRQGEVNPTWAVIDLMDLPTYQAYIAQTWASLSGPPR